MALVDFRAPDDSQAPDLLLRHPRVRKDRSTVEAAPQSLLIPAACQCGFPLGAECAAPVHPIGFFGSAYVEPNSEHNQRTCNKTVQFSTILALPFSSYRKNLIFRTQNASYEIPLKTSPENTNAIERPSPLIHFAGRRYPCVSPTPQYSV